MIERYHINIFDIFAFYDLASCHAVKRGRQEKESQQPQRKK